MPAVKITNKPVSTPGDQTHFLVTQPELPEGYTPTGQETEEELAELKVESVREIEMDDMVELIQDKLDMDVTPTTGSSKPVTSGGIKAALDLMDDDISSLNEDITNIQTATSEDEGKALKVKTVAGGKVTEWEFGDLDSDLLQELDGIVNGSTSSRTPEYTIVAGKYINSAGNLSTSENYSMTSEIPLASGDVITLTTHVKTACAVAKSLGSNLYEALVVESGNPSEAQEYTYTATEDMNIVLCERLDTLRNVTITGRGSDGLVSKVAGIETEISGITASVGDVESDVSDLKTYVGVPQTIVPEYTIVDGKYVNASSQISTSSNYSMTSDINLQKGDIISFTTLVRTACALAESLGSSLYEGLLVEPSYVSDPKDYTYTATRAMRVVICERGDTLTNVRIVRTPQDSPLSKMDALVDVVGSYDTVTPEYTLTEGYVINSSGNLSTNDTYEMTSSFRVQAGDKLSFKTHCKAVTVLAESLGNSQYRYLIRELTNPSVAQPYEFEVGADMDVVICGKIGTISNVTIERFSESGILPDVEQINQALPSGEHLTGKTLNGNMSIKAFREYRFTDGTLPLYKDVLWYDGNGGFWLSNEVYSPRKYLFGWSNVLSEGVDPSMYSAFIVHDGSVLFVYGTQHQANAGSATPGDNYRKNPIIYQMVDGEYVGSVIDFGSSLKPTNWLQNIGVIESARYDCIIFCEYTRALEQKARVWRVTFPITEPTNWTVVLQYDIAHPYGEYGFKHFHAVQEDPFYDVIYVTSGDDAVSCGCWASTDGGLTFTQVGSFDNAKWRLLNMVFRPDYVYWASDDWTPRHKFWKASRDVNHIIDYSSITEVCSFPDNSGSVYVATYASVYLECFNAILFLDRDDSDDSITALPINIYDLTDETLYTAGWLKKADSATYAFIGFRNDAVLVAPRDNKVAVGYSAYYANYNKLLGNIGTHTFETQINNLVLTIDRTADGYAVSFDTVK